MKKEVIQGAQRLENMYFSPVRQVLEKAAKIAQEGHPVIPFSAGEPDFDTPSQIKEETIKAIEKNLTHYAPNRGVLALREEISKSIESHCGIHYDANDEIILTAGGAEAVNNAFLAFINPGDEVIVFTPAFMNYENMIAMTGGVMVAIPLEKEDEFQINIEKVREKITSKTKMIVVNNPCNPTGVVYKKEVLEQLSELAVEHNLLVFSDEIYNEISYDGESCYSIASFEGMRERTITMNGFSKSYAMTGWRLGILASDADIITKLLKIHQYTTTCTPTFIQHGLVASMNSSRTKQEKAEMLQAFARRRTLLLEGLDEIESLSYIKPMGAFYVFVDVSKTGMTGEEYATRLLEEKYVATVPGIKLGKECGDFIRISFATSDENIKEGLRRMKEFEADYTK